MCEKKTTQRSLKIKKSCNTHRTVSEDNSDRASGIDPVKLLYERFLKGRHRFNHYFFVKNRIAWLESKGRSEHCTYKYWRALRSLKEVDISPLMPLKERFLQISQCASVSLSSRHINYLDFVLFSFLNCYCIIQNYICTIDQVPCIYYVLIFSTLLILIYNKSWTWWFYLRTFFFFAHRNKQGSIYIHMPNLWYHMHAYSVCVFYICNS